jgi:hypothetical protein
VRRAPDAGDHVDRNSADRIVDAQFERVGGPDDDDAGDEADENAGRADPVAGG